MKIDIDLNLLRVLVSLHELQSVSRTASALGKSQPSVSLALRKLREVFSDPLFVKTAGGMRPTVLAGRLLGPITDALRKIDDEIVSDIAFDPSLSRRTFTFALSDIGERWFLPPLTKHIAKHAPFAKIQSVAPPLLAIAQGLERGEIDLVIGYRPDLKRSTYFQQRLFANGSVCLLRADHPCTGNRLTVKQFSDLNHVVVRAENRAQEELEQFFARRRIQRRISLRTPHFMTVPLLIAQSDMVVTLPQFLAAHMIELYPNLKIMQPDIKLPTFEVKQYWHRRFHNDPTNKWLRKLAARLFQSEPERQPRVAKS